MRQRNVTGNVSPDSWKKNPAERRIERVGGREKVIQ